MSSWAALIRNAADAAAREHGTAVRELAGFATRGHADPGRLTGTILHDTITPSSWSSSQLSALLRDGYAGLPGPIANVQLDRDGTLVLIAARKAHHAGNGSWSGIASGNANACGIEAANNGRPERWTDRQRAIALTFATELHRAAGLDHRTVIGHREWAAGRKTDPWSLDLPLIRSTISARLADRDPDPAPDRSVAAMAAEVIDGKHGNGHAQRRKSLGVSEPVYAQVRAEVNRRLTDPAPDRSVAAMAAEVIDGKHGNGHAQRRKSLGVSEPVYAQVRAEVNRRLG